MKTFNWENLSTHEKTRILERPTHDCQQQQQIQQQTQRVIDAVKQQGDEAVFHFTQQFDQAHLNCLAVTPEELEQAKPQIAPEIKQAIIAAANNIEKFHQAQLPQSIRVETAPGITCEKQCRPIQKVGLYIPGGSAPLISTVLMLGVPAHIAQCPQRILCTPPRQDGSIDPHILFAALHCNIEQIYKVGGAQAIAAMAYGTQTIPKVNKIFGPGNAWVTQAKISVAQDPQGAAYDLPAGPSEVMVIADEHANPVFVAADLISQAEHGPDSQVILVSTHQTLIDATLEQLQQQLTQLPRQDIAKQSLAHSAAILVNDIDSAIHIANEYAAEHLILQIQHPRHYINMITHAGSVFLGPWTPESVGDYASGTNHVLPTYGYARNYSGLGVQDFMLQISFQELTQTALQQLAPTVSALAEIEGLIGHQRAVTLRVGDSNDN